MKSFFTLISLLLISSIASQEGDDETPSSSVFVVGKEPLAFPPVLESSNGILDISISIKYANWSIVQRRQDDVDEDDEDDVVLALRNTRLLDGILPGKTLIVSPGDTLRIFYTNELELQEETAVNTGLNVLGYPDHVNLHFHGSHVSGELPSDDIRMKMDPQTSFQYETKFPANHMGGTHWIHPHVHGSSALQVGGGAAGTLIVRDIDNSDYYQLPDIVKNATEVLLFVQDMHPNELERIRVASGDEKLSIEKKIMQPSSLLPNRFRIINGQYQPYYEIQAQEWYRFRIVYAGWLEEPLKFAIEKNDDDSTDGNDDSNCEMMLLAKDGIYINDFPRKIISALPIPTGGRADVMIKCNQPGAVHNVIDFASQTVLELRVVSKEEQEGQSAFVAGTETSTAAVVVEAAVLPSWTPQLYPEYLRDLRQTEPTKGCSCATQMRDCPDDILAAGGYDDDHKCINGELFHPDKYIHSIPFGSIVQRLLSGNRIHPYHQHVYPFQLIYPYAEKESMTEMDYTYFQAGDWHDVFSSKSGASSGQVVRFHTDVHFGRLMVHCHVLAHEDMGVMTQEYVGDPETTECSCSPPPLRGSRSFFTVTNIIILVVVIIVIIALLIAIAIFCILRRKK